jgi:hypothetical protein
MFLSLIVLHFTQKRVVSRRSMLYPAPRWKQRSPLVRLLIEGLCRIGKDFPLPKNDARIPTLSPNDWERLFPAYRCGTRENRNSPQFPSIFDDNIIILVCCV